MQLPECKIYFSINFKRRFVIFKYFLKVFLNDDNLKVIVIVLRDYRKLSLY